MLERTDTTRLDRGCGGFEYEKRKAGNPGIDLKCPRSNDLNLDYVLIVAAISPPFSFSSTQ